MGRKSSEYVLDKKRFLLIFMLLLILACLIILIIIFFSMNEEEALSDSQENTVEIIEEPEEVIENKILSINSNVNKVYLARDGGVKQLEVEFLVVGEPDKTLTWTSSDENIVSVQNGLVSARNVGDAVVSASTVDGQSLSFDIVVTDLITVPVFNSKKSLLPCKIYSKEEADLLDQILEARVSEAGYGTRAGAVAAARFLLLEFPYTIRYFNENGRMAPGHNQIDGEGRYYHKGLYLHSSKFSQITKSTSSGPAIWGCGLYDRYIGQVKPNGFTCSGFVTWTLFNGGFDVGDVGAGDYPNVFNELSDLGPRNTITYDFMKNGSYKVGDLVGRDGHSGIIIGISDDTIYTAEALPYKLEVYVYDRYSGIVKDNNLDYILDMSGVYPNGEGNISDMW